MLYKKDGIIELTCDFDFRNLPNDNHICPVTIYSEYWNSSFI